MQVPTSFRTDPNPDTATAAVAQVALHMILGIISLALLTSSDWLWRHQRLV